MEATKPIDIDTIDALWARYSHNHEGLQLVAPGDLASITANLGAGMDAVQIQHLLADCGAPKGLGKDAFIAFMASSYGDPHARLSVAFDVFDANGDGRINIDELYGVLGKFGMRRTELEQLISEADQEGKNTIEFNEFCAMMPETDKPPPNSYVDNPIHYLKSAQSIAEARNQSNSDLGIQPSEHRADEGQGTSRLQMQIGLFRLLQGAAYRCFRENCAANYETHLRAKALPYTITHYVEFTERAIALYKALGIVDEDCHAVLDAVPASLRAEHDRLEHRIANWKTIPKTPQMHAASEAMVAAQRQGKSIRHVFAAAVECALTLSRKGLDPASLGAGLMENSEISRLRNLELRGQAEPSPQDENAESESYINTWNRVILQSVDEDVAGAMMPAAYWYEDFMPKLLAACSVSSAADVDANTEPNEPALDQWFDAAQRNNEFHPFGESVAEHYAKCTPKQKLKIRQAWRLTRHYLNGVQKRRERLEFGRETGFLSQYVAFLDIYLGRSDVRDAEMRLSFPYYIGPTTWRFLHTAAEIIADRDTGEQEKLVSMFKDFLRLFATTYPCPYCRYHFNRYVVLNRETGFYPLEYLLLGAHPERGSITVSMEDKLEAIHDGKTLRLFLWKLHNAVSSSISRTEAWFHREENPFYTSRFWPSVSAEALRVRAQGAGELSDKMRARLGKLDEPVNRLSVIHEHLRKEPDDLEIADFVEDAKQATEALETAINAGAFLETTYRFDPALEDDEPHFTPAEEAYSRSGKYVQS